MPEGLGSSFISFEGPCYQPLPSSSRRWVLTALAVLVGLILDLPQGMASQVKALTSSGYRVVVPDVLGFGASSKPKDVEAYRIKNVSAVMYGLLDHLGIDKVIIVGHDWGAFLTWGMVSAKPERCHKVVVLSCGHGLSFFTAGGITQREKSWYMLFFRDPQAEELLKADDWALWKNLMRSKAPDDEFAAKQIENMSQDGALTAGLNWYRANSSMKQFAMTVPPKQQRIQVPILGIWSSQDHFLTEEQMKASEMFVQEGLFQYKRIEGASHWMQRDAPDALNDALLRFFRE